jgi:histidinol-phosphate aminotransferase
VTRTAPFDVLSLVRSDLRDLAAYQPVEPPDVRAKRLGVPEQDVLKLDGNENPFGPSPRALEALRQESGYQYYPDPTQTKLRERLAEYVRVPPEAIVAGAGSDDLIDLVLRAIVTPGDTVIDCPPTFGMYAFLARIAGARVAEVPRREDFALDVDAIVPAAVGAKAIFLASPNNPTGNVTPRGDIERLLDLGVLVVVDEAYVEFAGNSVVDLVAERENLVVLRTFSKWAGLAGLRAGYGVMAPALAAVLMRIKQPYNVSVAAQIAAVAALEDREVLGERVRAIVRERERLAALLADIPWVTVYPSSANFVLCRLAGRDARAVRDALARRGVFVRYFDRHPVGDCLRISVPAPGQSERVAQALREAGEAHGR